MEKILITAVNQQEDGSWGIGFDGKLPWHIPEELRHFKKMTMGYPIIMGRKTAESLGKALPGRENYVLTRGEYERDGFVSVNNLEEVFGALSGQEIPPEKVFIIGGAAIYTLALEEGILDRMEITYIHGEYPVDTFFPKELIDWDEWEEVGSMDQGEYTSVSYKRIDD